MDDDLNVQVNNQAANQIMNQPVINRIRNWVSGPKIVFVVLGVVLFAEFIYAFRTLSSPMVIPTGPTATTPAVTIGKISLVAPKNNFNVGENVPVSVVLDTGGHSLNGVDLIVHYDPKLLDASAGGIVRGLIFDDYPAISVSPDKGLITVSGIDNMSNTFNSNNPIYGAGQFVVINLKAKAPGRTTLSIDFNGKGSTTDSNLVEAVTAKDILEKVDNLELTVK